MIRRLLIANRGEIACRIARTAHAMGIATVGVHEAADTASTHVDVVGQSVVVPSHLDGEAIIAAALRTGADAIHPGYGFLSERADFAAAVVAAGLTWVGPTSEQISQLGDKVTAKSLAIASGVPTTPLVEVRNGEPQGEIAFPVLVKAAAGGGGRGMRMVQSPEALSGAIASAVREAEAAFGDGRVFLEPFIERGRHVEVQIFGDQHGNVVHLGDRDCSIQRRNQKIIEEAPAPNLSDEVRSRLHEGAVALGRSIGYVSAGTVEFLVGDDGSISFLEVNTRLQVEHPVTEAVTGLDLVELQLRVAAGEPLPFEQSDIAMSGHAIEVRIVAEDPRNDWLPAVGTITDATFPEHVRVDSGISAGSLISTEYDSMLAKVIVHSNERPVAASQLAGALRASTVSGVETNIELLIAVLEANTFVDCQLSTAFLTENSALLSADTLDEAEADALVIAAMLAKAEEHRSANPVTGFAPSGWRNLRVAGQRQAWRLPDGETVELEYVLGDGDATVLIGAPPAPDDTGALSVDDRRSVAVSWQRPISEPSALAITLEGIRTVVSVHASGDAFVASSPRGQLRLRPVPAFEDPGIDQIGAGPTSPLPGTVVSVHVDIGDHVEAGDLLVVVEAMKMEHKIRAAVPAVVTAVRHQPGERVDTGELLVELDDAPSESS